MCIARCVSPQQQLLLISQLSPPLSISRPGSGSGLLSWSLCPHCRKFMAPGSPRPLKCSAFSQLLPRPRFATEVTRPLARGWLLGQVSGCENRPGDSRESRLESKCQGDISPAPAPLSIGGLHHDDSLSHHHTGYKHRTLSGSSDSFQLNKWPESYHPTNLYSIDIFASLKLPLE